MRHHRRIPALIVLIIALGAGALYGWRSSAARNGNHVTLGQIQQKIRAMSGNVDAATWADYARLLSESGKHAQAADAYRKALAKEPSRREARIGCASALAASQNPDEYYKFLRHMLTTEDGAQLVVELLEKPEAAGYLKRKEFIVLQKDAKAQAMD